MRQRIDYNKYKGQKFDRLLVLEATRVGPTPYFYCLCDCGTHKLINATNVLRGLTASCGCARKDRLSLLGIKQETIDEIVLLRASGLSYRKIASRLNLSVGTVNRYCSLLKSDIDKLVEDNLWK